MYYKILHEKRCDMNLHVFDTVGSSQYPVATNNGTAADLIATTEDHSLPWHSILQRNTMCQSWVEKKIEIKFGGKYNLEPYVIFFKNISLLQIISTVLPPFPSPVFSNSTLHTPILFKNGVRTSLNSQQKVVYYLEAEQVPPSFIKAE